MGQLNLYREIITGNTFVDEAASGIFKHSADTITPTNYEQVTGSTSELLVSWDLYGKRTQLSNDAVREQISFEYSGNTFTGLTSSGQNIVAKWFVTDQADIDSIHSAKVKRENSDLFTTLLKEDATNREIDNRAFNIKDSEPSMVDGLVKDAEILNIGRVQMAMNISGNKNIDLDGYINHVHLKLSGDTTVTFSGLTNNEILFMMVEQDDIGAHSLTWPASVMFPSGISPVASTEANAMDTYIFGIMHDEFHLHSFIRSRINYQTRHIYPYNFYSDAGTFNGVAYTVGGSSVLFDRHFFKNYTSAGNRVSQANFVLPYNYMSDSDIKINISWANANTSGNVRWIIGMTGPHSDGQYGTEDDTEYIVALEAAPASPEYKQNSFELEFDGTGLKSGDNIAIIMLRNGAHSGDTSGTAYIGGMEIKYISDRI